MSTPQMKRRIVKGLLLLPALGILALLLSAAATGLRENKDPEQAAPRDGRFVQTRDARVFVRRQGAEEGTPVLLIHGTGAWGEIWRTTTDALAARKFCVMTVDVPPFGFSEKLAGSGAYAVGKQADRLLDVLSALDAGQTTIVCHSVGCRPAVEAVLKKPGVAARLVLVDPALGFADDRSSPHFEQKNPGTATRAFFAAGPLRDAVTGLYGTNPYSIRPLFRSFVSNKAAVTDARLAVLKEPLAVRGMTRAEGDWLQNLVASPEHGRFTDFESFRTLKMPVLIIWGRDDAITPLWQGEALQSLIAGSKLSVIPDCGHIPYIEQAAAFNERLLEFLGEK